MNKPIKLIRLCLTSAAAALLLAAVTVADGQTLLVDIGNDTSYRGLTTANPDNNGNHWTSVWSGAFYENIVDTTGTATEIDFGFSFATGTDSYNGPAGATDSATTKQDLLDLALFQDIDTAALGLIGGAPEAAFDYYVTSNFEVLGLDPTKRYDLTFFGSHKYNDDNTTRYSVYTDNTYTTLVDSVDLEIGVEADHNRDTTATLAGLAPQESDILYVKFEGATGGSGFLNALQIDVVTPDVTPGDFNSDGAVDAADYALWRNNKDQDESVLGGAGDGSNTVDAGDYDLWRMHYGTGVTSLTATAAQAPEPGSIGIMLGVLSLSAFRRRRRA